MPFLDVMHTYFRGEKVEALAFILPIALLLLVFAGVVLKVERSAFGWGVAVPAILGGLILAATGIGVGTRTANQVEELERSFARSPAAMVEQELPRMRKVNRNFRATLIAFGVTAAIGLVLIYAVRGGWAQGLGSGLILVAALGLLIDGFAARRAAPYTAALEEIAAQHRLARE